MKILQEGCIKRLYEASYDSSFHPLVQVIECQPVEGGRFSMVLSDGVLSCKCIASPQLGEKIMKGDVKVLSVGTVNNYTKTNVRGSTCISINDFVPLIFPSEREGNPHDIESTSSRICSVPTPSRLEPSARPPPSVRSDNYTPIRALSTFNSDWMIKARVTKKSDVKEWNNARGTGKLFNANLMDSMGDEISATFFNQGVEKYYPILVENHIYTFTKGQVKLANKKFTSIQCEYQLSFDKNAEIFEATDDGSIDNIRFNLVTLDALQDILKRGGQQVVDVCAVVKEIGELSEFTSKKGDRLKKRVLILVDKSNYSVELTLWNDETDNPLFESPPKPLVLLAKSLKISEFNNISLGTDRNASKLIFNPVGMKDAENMISWRDHYYNPLGQITALSMRSGGSRQREYRTMRSIVEEWGSCMDTTISDIYIVRGYVNFIKHDENSTLWYPSCFNADKCKKKMIKEDDMFRCETCNQSFQHCVYRYVVSMKLCDETEGIWVSVFDKEFVEMVGMQAQELKDVMDRNEEEFKEKITSILNRHYEFVIRAAVQDNGQGPRSKYSVVGMSSIDQKKLTKSLLQDLENMLSIH